jgi:hypothetical protein
METKSATCLPTNESYKQVDLIPQMFSQLKIAGINIVLVALSAITCLSILDSNTQKLTDEKSRGCPSSNESTLETLKGIINGNQHLQLFFNNSSTVVCDRISIVVDKLELHNLKVVNINPTLMSPYRPLEGTRGSEDGFVLFGFYELPP